MRLGQQVHIGVRTAMPAAARHWRAGWRIVDRCERRGGPDGLGRQGGEARRGSRMGEREEGDRRCAFRPAEAGAEGAGSSGEVAGSDGRTEADREEAGKIRRKPPRRGSSSKTPGILTTSSGFRPFSNRANFRAAAWLTNRPPRRPLWSCATHWPRLFRPSRKSEAAEAFATKFSPWRIARLRPFRFQFRATIARFMIRTLRIAAVCRCARRHKIAGFRQPYRVGAARTERHRGCCLTSLCSVMRLRSLPYVL